MSFRTMCNLNARQRLRNVLSRAFMFESNHERNYVAALLNLLALIILSATLADDEWFHLRGGGCQYHNLGMTWFYQRGSFEQHCTGDSAKQRCHTVFIVGERKYVDCVNVEIADLFHGLMGVCFAALSTIICGIILDLFGPKKGLLRCLRRYGLYSVVAVLYCLVMLALAYWAGILIEEQQRGSTVHPGQVVVTFSDGFYMLIAAAVILVCSVATSLFRTTWLLQRMTEEDQLALCDNEQGLMTSNDSMNVAELLPGSGPPPPPSHPGCDLLMAVPPPPAYTP